MPEQELRDAIREGMRSRSWAVFDGMNDGERPAGETWTQAILDSIPAGWVKFNDGRWIRLDRVDLTSFGDGEGDTMTDRGAGRRDDA